MNRIRTAFETGMSDDIEWEDVAYCPGCSTLLLIRKCRDCGKVFLIDPSKSTLQLDHCLDISGANPKQGVLRHFTDDELREMEEDRLIAEHELG